MSLLRASPHYSREFQWPVLYDDDREVIAILHHQEPTSIPSHSFSLMSYQVERVKTVEEFPWRIEAEWPSVRQATCQ